MPRLVNCLIVLACKILSILHIVFLVTLFLDVLSLMFTETSDVTEAQVTVAMTSGANVVVLSQPQEMAVMTTAYDSSQPDVSEHVTYEREELLRAELAPKDLASGMPS